MSKILFCTGSLGKGGAERVITKICNGLAKAGHKVYIACFLSCKKEYDIDSNITIIDLTESKRTLTSFFRWIKRLKQTIKKLKPDSIVSFGGRINILTLLSCKKNIAVVSERNDPRFDGRPFLTNLLCKILYSHKAKTVVFQTYEVMNLFSKRIRSKSVVIRNPVSAPSITKSDYRDASKIIMVGRLEKQKNYMLAIEAVSILSKKYPIDLCIFGAGSEIDFLKQNVNELGVERNVHFMGITNNPDKEMADSSIFLLSSLYEGLSNSLIEAMAIGLPVISTPVSGSNEIITNGVNGILLPSFNTAVLVDELEKLICNQELRNTLGNNAMKSTKHFYESIVLSEWNSVIL